MHSFAILYWLTFDVYQLNAWMKKLGFREGLFYFVIADEDAFVSAFVSLALGVDTTIADTAEDFQVGNL
ncbi:unnamed protein product [Aphanomyces euteiches]|uniref:Uncharacterized protein n=1 Tax=Aphanomyces euteiches TaxID=100861 RepID=A0A6G0WQE6_9STRA|nr:hypothetical protein Ae201684_012865 [Aphanomyces euteiches]KAH9097514.1 hypothetical protein Ae201684P_000992 [Aphanomyces euteiches]